MTEVAAGASTEPPRAIRAAVSWQGFTPAAVGVIPGALTLYFSFKNGAYFPGATAVGALVLLGLLLVRVALAEHPFAGFSTALGVAAAAMALFAGWALVSAAWADAPARAITEFDRALLYLLALVFFGSLPRTPQAVRYLIWGLAAAITAVCVAAFITRTVPDAWSAPTTLQRDRLSYPIGYWNSLGLMASLALVFCLHLTCSAREPRPVRLLAAATPPVIAGTLLLTYSRGAMAVAAVGPVVYLVLGRPKLALTGLIACVPTTAVAVLKCYRANFAADFIRGHGYAPLTASGLEEAHGVAITVAACAGVAVLIRALGMLALDPTLGRVRLRRRTRRALALAAAGMTTLALVVGVAQASSNGWLSAQYNRLVHDPVTQTGDYRDRLFNPGLARVDLWRVAFDAFKDAPLRGTGAGTYRLSWERHRPSAEPSNDAHSLYLEALGEGGVVGAALLAVVLLLVLGGFAAGLRRKKQRSVYAALLAGGLVWAIHAAVDWDWELPALTMWLFVAGGLALRPSPERSPARLGGPLRVVAVVGLVLLAITPARLALSQHHLAASLHAYRAGRCPQASAEARSSISALGNRPEPYQIEGYCLARSGDPAGAVEPIRQAIGRDPGNWRYHYALALAQGLAGVDPRPEAHQALLRNPREPKAREAATAFDSSPRRGWRRAARALAFKR